MPKQPLTKGELDQLVADLHRVSRNLWWTWDQEAQEVFHDLSPRGWQNLNHNAVAILHEVSDSELRVRLNFLDFADRAREVIKSFDAYMHEKATWGEIKAPQLKKNPI